MMFFVSLMIVIGKHLATVFIGGSEEYPFRSNFLYFHVVFGKKLAKIISLRSVEVAEWLERLTAKREVSQSNLIS